MFDALLGMESGEAPKTEEQPPAEETKTEEQQAEGTEEGAQEQEISALQKRFTDAEGNFDAAGALKTIEDLGGLHSQTAKGLAEKDAYIQRLERALESQARGGETQPKAEQPTEKLLPEGYEGVLTENDLALIRKTVGGTLESSQEAQREATAKAAEDAAVDRAGTFKTMSQGLATKFRSTYGITDEQGNAMDEIILADPELTTAAERYIIAGEGEFPGELLEKKMIQAYGQITQKTQEKTSAETGNVEALVAEGVKKALQEMGINPQQTAREQVENVSRETEHPIQPIEGQEGGEKDYFDQYLESQGMENLDPSLKMLLREMDHGTPN